jgi:hypothetical protein
VGGVLVSLLAGAGYKISPEKATRLLNVIWSALKKLSPKKTHVKVISGKVTIDIDADSGESARLLLQAGAEVVTTIAANQPPAAPAARKRAVTLKPGKR